MKLLNFRNKIGLILGLILGLVSQLSLADDLVFNFTNTPINLANREDINSKLVCSTPVSRFSQCVPSINAVIFGSTTGTTFKFSFSGIQKIIYPANVKCPVDSLSCALILNDTLTLKVNVQNIARVPSGNSVAWAITQCTVKALIKNNIAFTNLYGQISYPSYNTYYQNAYVTVINT
jgi:hypothetical protein